MVIFLLSINRLIVLAAILAKLSYDEMDIPLSADSIEYTLYMRNDIEARFCRRGGTTYVRTYVYEWKSSSRTANNDIYHPFYMYVRY